MDVSIVIVSYNTSKLLDECIVSIKKETTVSSEVIVVDNASTDNSCQMLREKYPEVTLIENRENAGFARANNQGFAIASGKYYFMLNPDTLILAGAIDKLVAFMESNHDVGICGPRNIGVDGILKYNCDHFPSVWNVFCEYTNIVNRFPSVPLFRRTNMRYWDYADQRDVERMVGCSLMIRSDLYKKLDGLDDHYFMYFEETDFCFRASRLGIRTVYFPHAVIIHYGGESSQSQSIETVIDGTISTHFLNSQYYFMQKNYGTVHALTMRALDFCCGATLLLRNAMRSDKAKRGHGRLKGRSLLTNALRFS
jgi:N-acetylglucosaminyl-diphospho-decaprenol L-rhamnosyltransferase